MQAPSGIILILYYIVGLALSLSLTNLLTQDVLDDRRGDGSLVHGYTRIAILLVTLCAPILSAWWCAVQLENYVFSLPIWGFALLSVPLHALATGLVYLALFAALLLPVILLTGKMDFWREMIKQRITKRKG
ncbi:hypothetical protein LJC33_07605 [Eubacteriales bacterium OttesenSCG-928-N13]|nr:hypothetical protein [Eubacteriales bacterium OttesenSCG-928-N13]